MSGRLASALGLALLLGALPGCGLWVSGQEIDADRDGSVAGVDCDDQDPDRSAGPWAEELCDGIDNDCDDKTDEFTLECPRFDCDGDGFGVGWPEPEDCLCGELAIPAEIERCPIVAPQPSAGSDHADTIDCDDQDPGVAPGSPDTCDGLDNDCDSVCDEDFTDGRPVPEAQALFLYIDEDGDGYGDPDDPAPLTFCATAGGRVLGAEGECSAGPMEDLPATHVDNALDCRDDMPEINPDAVEVCNNGFDDDCDGLAGSESSVGEDGELGPSQLCDADDVSLDALVFHDPTLTETHVGVTLAVAPAWGPDGQDALIAGGPGNHKLFLWFLDASWLPQDEAESGWTVADPDFVFETPTGEDSTPKFCTSVAPIGDFDGDGLLDVVAGGADSDLGFDSEVGEAYILLGRESWPETLGPTSEGVIAIRGTQGMAVSVTGPGDLDGDGRSDFVMGLPTRPIVNGQQGGALVVHGLEPGAPVPTRCDYDDDELTCWGAGGEPVEVAATVTHHEGTWHNGATVQGVGDFNGDGAPDFVSRPEESGSLVVFGREAPATGDKGAVGFRDLTEEHWGALRVFNGTQNWQKGSVAGLGDVDGDGYDDVAMGAPQGGGISTDDEGPTGVVYVVFGQPIDPDDNADCEVADLTLGVLCSARPDVLVPRYLGEGGADRVGYAVSSPGDLDGDGSPELLVNARDWDHPDYAKEDQGAVYLFSGAALGDSVTMLPAGALRGTEFRARFGAAFANSTATGAPDASGSIWDPLDDDGVPDILTAAPFSGPENTAGGQGAGSMYLVSGQRAWQASF